MMFNDLWLPSTKSEKKAKKIRKDRASLSVVTWWFQFAIPIINAAINGVLQSHGCERQHRQKSKMKTIA
jgi:hypothetical protein